MYLNFAYFLNLLLNVEYSSSFKFVGEGRVQRLFHIQELTLGAFD